MTEQLRALLEREKDFWVYKLQEGDDRYKPRTCEAHIRNLDEALALLSQPPVSASEAYQATRYGLEAASGFFKGITPDRNTMTDAECEAAEAHIAESVERSLVALSSLPHQLPWRRVEDGTPEPGSEILMAWAAERSIQEGKFFGDETMLRGYAARSSRGHWVGKIGMTHWCYLSEALPAAPKQEG